MWNKVDEDIVIGKYYLTALYKFGEITNVQVLAFKQGVWWREDGTYTYYQPSHYKEFV